MLISSKGERIREDARVPVLVLQSETDVILLGGGLAEQPDSDRVRVWEMAGAAHADTYTVSAGRHDDGTLSAERLAELLRPTTNLMIGRTNTPINAGPQQHYVAQAALAHLTRWAAGGVAPPQAPRLDLDADRTGYRLDDHGNALGGIRTPWVDVPTAVLSGPRARAVSPSPCSSARPSPSTRPRWRRSIPAARLSTSSGSRPRLDATIAAGFLLEEDRAEILAVAAASYPLRAGRQPTSSTCRDAPVLLGCEKRLLFPSRTCFPWGGRMQQAVGGSRTGAAEAGPATDAVLPGPAQDATATGWPSTGVSFSIAEQECYGLLGPNGAGKTTTISMLCGLTIADEGEITIDGFAGGTLEAKASVGYVPQDLALYPDLSAVENLTFFGQLYGLAGKELQGRIGETLELVGLADRGKDRIGTYSGGMKRRANMAAGLLHRPKLLVLDEPTVGVDPQSRNAILETVGRLGIAVLYTTHYMEEAAKLCDRIGIIDDGHLIAEGTADSLIGAHGGRDKVHLSCDGAAAPTSWPPPAASSTTSTTCTRSTATSS